MPTQNDFLRVKEHVIEVLIRHWDVKFDQKMIDDYVELLCGYNEAQLKQGMKVVLADCKMKPKLAHIYEAAGKMKTDEEKTHKASSGIDPSLWWKKRQQDEEARNIRARAAAKDYTEILVREIKDEITSWPEYRKCSLIQFIAASAQFQADVIENVTNPGYRLPDICNEGDRPKDRFDWWKGMCRDAMVNIRVEIPWKWYGHTPAYRNDAQPQF